MNPQESPSHMPIATSGQPQEQVAQDTSARVDSIAIVTLTTEEQGKKEKRRNEKLISKQLQRIKNIMKGCNN